MNRTSKLARFICLLIVLTVFFCFVASLNWERTKAQTSNGRIAFTSNNVIYTINSDGSGLMQLTPTGSGVSDRYPVWSPNGTRFAFGRTTSTVKSQIYM